MEKETKKTKTTGAKKTTSAKKSTSTNKNATGNKQTKPVNKAKDSSKKLNNESAKKVEKVTNSSDKKKTNSKASKRTNTKKVTVEENKNEVKVEKKVNVSSKNDKVDKKIEFKEDRKKVVAKKSKEDKVKETTLGEELKSFIKSDIGSLIGIILIIVIVMGAFFFVTDFIKGLNEEEENLVVSQDVQYDEILLSNVLKQPKNAYYVLIYDKGTDIIDSKDIDIQTYEIYLDLYATTENALRIYKADLTQKFNEPYVANEKSNLLVSDVAELKVQSTTLVKVENGSIVAAFDTRDSIVEHLLTLVK